MGAEGKTIEVQGGRTVRPSATKLRHNKVYTAKGLRDRRLRLSADTAILFYDVQDRLGYERASDAVDWLIQKAKDSIDKLFDTTSQQLEHLNHLGYQKNAHGDYQEESLLARGKYYGDTFHQSHQYQAQNCHKLDDNLVNISGYSYTDSSLLSPCIHMGDCSASSSKLEHHIRPSYQQIFDKGQIQRTNMFSSDSNSSEEHFVLNAAPLFFMPSALGQNDNSSSDHATSGSNSKSDHCVATGRRTSVVQSNTLSSDELMKHYISQQNLVYQEQVVTFNQLSFRMPASSHGTRE